MSAVCCSAPIALPNEMLVRSSVGLDVCSLCRFAATSATLSKLVVGQAWRYALLVPQTPPEPPGTYSTVFTSVGVDFFEKQEGSQNQSLSLNASEGSRQELEAFDAAEASLLCWSAGSAMHQLVSKPTLRNVARFVRLQHSGVEADTLKVVRHGSDSSFQVHVAFEALNFFPVPVWVAIWCEEDALGVTVECNFSGGEAVMVVRGFSNHCDQWKYDSRMSMVVLEADFYSDGCHRGRVDLFYVTPYCRIEIGEHVLRTCGTSQQCLRFAFFEQLSFGEPSGAALEKKLDLKPKGSRVLIPTTRASHFALDRDGWIARGFPDTSSLSHRSWLVRALPSSVGTDPAQEDIELTSLDDVGVLTEVCQENVARVSFSDVLYSGRITLDLDGKM
eukprot:TRINITY_DN39889_c0_g1_i1.p1 TRINITY_DN39889_c0_g1~~TRINITY_DN39889_c0_g1_i1.p1  ORF type:complete len:389 (+),score=42.62 TRINITY_DN39889_c0_g1_i1:41-1207(+)